MAETAAAVLQAPALIESRPRRFITSAFWITAHSLIGAAVVLAIVAAAAQVAAAPSGTFTKWLTVGIGMIGSLMIAVNKRWSGWGYAICLTYSVPWMAFALQTEEYPLFGICAFYTLCNVTGVWRWELQPRLRRRRQASGDDGLVLMDGAGI